MGALAIFAATLCASWIYTYGERLDGHLFVGAVVFAGFILAGKAFSTRIDARYTVSATDIGLIAAVAVLGPVWAVLAALPADLLVARRSRLRMAYEASHTVFIVFLSGTVFSFVSEPLMTRDAGPSVDLFYGALVAGTVLVAANATLDGTLLRVKYDQPLPQSWRENTQPYLLSNAVDVLTAGFGVLVLAAYGPISALIVLAGSVGSQLLIYYVRRHKEKLETLAAAQACAAMVLDQPRRPGVGPTGARRELGKGAETQFDGLVVRAFLRILDAESEGYRMADHHRFALPSPDQGHSGVPGGGSGRATAAW